MSSSPEIRKSSTTSPPLNAGNESAASENSSLTVELFPSSVGSEGKTSVLTTGPIDSNFTLSGSAVANMQEATVIRRPSNSQEIVGSHSSTPDSFSSHKTPNANVEFIDNNQFNDDLINKEFGIFYVQKKIGKGGMGDVYLATDTLLDRVVALKVLNPKQSSEEFRERFIIEAKASAKLHHENIVTVYSFGEIKGRIYLAMEYIPGVNLRDKENQDGPLSIEESLSYAIQMTAALEHIHQKGIVHRDIKPSNVIITDDGLVKVIDLGLAKDTVLPATDLTQTGVTLGTFDYISPEQALDSRKVDIRSDIYSLGCTLYFMLVGKPPFPDRTGLQKLLSHQGLVTPNVQTERPDVPDRLAALIMRCMAKDANMRYQTPQELSQALYNIAEEQGMRPSGISLSKWYLPSKSRLRVWKDRLSWAVPIVILVFAIMILDCIWKPNQRQSEFLPETPGFKRNIVSIHSGGRSSSIFVTPVKKGKAFEFDSEPQSFPQPPDLSSTENEPMQTSDNSEDLNASVDNNPSLVVKPVPTLSTTPSDKTQQNNDAPSSAAQERSIPHTPNSSMQKNIIHSVRFETD